MLERIQSIHEQLIGELDRMRFAAPVTHVYNPLVYAAVPFAEYLRRFAGLGSRAGRDRVLLLGMNPGPWGMAQTGVPFGEVELVRDWLGIEAPVAKPPDEHPKRPVLGFACTRREPSGKRLWGWAHDTFGTPDRFFEHFFIANYCPLIFLEDTGRNRTPDRLKAEERAALYEACDRALAALVEVLEPRRVIGIGRFAETRAQAALPPRVADNVGRVLHPSPANPQANAGWAPLFEQQLADLGIYW